MDKHQLVEHRRSLVQQRDAEIDAIKLRYGRKLAALDVLLDDELSTKETTSNAPIPAQKHAAKNLFEAICEAITHSQADFSSTSLFEHYVRDRYKDFASKPTDLSNALWRLRKAGQIEVISKGSGQSPSRYRKTPLFDAANSVASK